MSFLRHVETKVWYMATHLQHQTNNDGIGGDDLR